MRKSYQFRIYPTKHQETLLKQTLEECRWLYNQLLEQRKTAWEERSVSLGLYDQQALLPAMKMERPALKAVHSQVLQNVAVRIDLTFKAFFRRVKAGEKPGYPRFRGVGRYDSFCYPQGGWVVDPEHNTVTLSKIGTIKAVLHRPIHGKVKTCCVRRSGTGKWCVTFSCEDVPADAAPESNEPIGIDVGLTTFAALSNGERVANPRFFRREEKALAKAQRRLSKEEKGTPERAKRRKPVARIHERIRFRRHDFTHQVARRIVDAFGLIAVEDLAVNRMVHNHCLAKSIQDAAWAQFTANLSDKAACAGRKFIAVNPAYTSQDCSGCGHRQHLSLSERVYHCSDCGLHIDRDLNAARNILALGQQGLGTAPRSRLL